MDRLARSVRDGALLVLGMLAVACNPPGEGGAGLPASGDDHQVAQVSKRQANITAQQAVTAAQNGLNFVLTDAYNWISGNGCAACHRGGPPLFSGALSVKNGLSVNRSQLDWLAAKEAGEQLAWGDNYWLHDPSYLLRFSKGSWESWAVAGYTAYSGNTSYMNQLKGAWDWLRQQTGASGIAASYAPPAYNGSAMAYYNGNYYAGNWKYTFPNDGKSMAGLTRWFIPEDYHAPPANYNWPQPTGLTVAAMSLWLNSNQGLSAADRTTYSNFRDQLADSIEGTYARSAGSWTINELFHGLNGLIAAGRTPALNANAAGMRDEILNRKIAGAAGWADPNVGYGSSSAGSTGQALYALCQAGVRLDQNQSVNDAINWLASIQNGDGSWSYPGYTVDIPTSYAVLGLSCYGVLNINVTISNVAPADPNNVGAAQLSPGIAGTQSVTFNLNVQNQGYVTNSFTFSGSGGVAGTTFSFNPATLTVGANATGTTQVTATFPSNLQAGISVPISVATTYVAAGGTTSTTKGLTVNVGNVANPGAGALVTSTNWLAGNGASVQVGNNLTLTVNATQGGAAVNAGSVTFFVAGQAVGTVTPSGGQFSLVWTVPSNITGNASIQANFSGAVVGATSYAASSVSGAINITLPPPPPAPGINGPANGYTSTSGVVTVTGSSQAGAILTVKSSGGANLGSVSVPVGGAFSVPLNLPPGVYVITAVATNAGGNSPASSAITINILPMPTTITSPAGGSQTANTTVTLTGTAYPGGTVTVTDAGATVGTFTADANGNWSGNVALTLGAHTLAVTTTVSGATSAATNLAIGIVPPAPTITAPLANANLPNGNNVVTGTATAGTTVTVLDGGVAVGSGVAAANGQYNITVSLGYGTHTITTTATNAGGTSAASAGVTVKVAPGAPVITTPAVAVSDLIGPFTFAGTAVGGATVTIYDNGVQINQQVAAANGSFSHTVAAPTLGAHNLTATQTANGLTSPASAARTITVHADADGDGVYDEVDNCSNVWNKDQVDRDGDGLGDVCDQAPGQKDSTNQTTSSTDLGVSSLADAGSDDTLLAKNQNNLVTLPAGAWGTRNTLTLVVDTAANPTGNIQLYGKAMPSTPTWTLMTTYDLQLGPNHPVVMANGLQAQVNVVTPRTSLANYAFRYRQVQARVKEADGSITTLPSCNSGTVSANDSRCVSVSNAYQIVDGTNVDQGVKFTFTMKAL